MSEPTTQERVAAIRARLAARTPGEWTAVYAESDSEWHPAQIGITVKDAGFAIATADDEELLAYAPADLAFLADEVERLRSALAHIVLGDGTCEGPCWSLYATAEGVANHWKDIARRALTAQPGAGE